MQNKTAWPRRIAIETGRRSNARYLELCQRMEGDEHADSQLRRATQYEVQLSLQQF